jgi:hypothetical protein
MLLDYDPRRLRWNKQAAVMQMEHICLRPYMYVELQAGREQRAAACHSCCGGGSAAQSRRSFEDAADEEGAAHAGNDEGEEADPGGDIRPVYTKDVAKNVLMPELKSIELGDQHIFGDVLDVHRSDIELAEDAWSVIGQERRVHLVLQLDGTYYRSLKDLLVKLEQAIVGIALEGSESAHQSLNWCQPVGFLQGDASRHAAVETRAAWSCAAHETDRIWPAQLCENQ